MADITKRLAGIAKFTISGTQYQLVGDLQYTTSTRERETLMGMDGYHGYSEKNIPGFMSMKVRDSSAINTAVFNDMVDVPVTAETANGKSVSGDGMVCMKAVDVNTMDGTFELRFEGPDVSES